MTPLARRENLVLVGYRACGKTELGRRAASALERPFFDLDREIEAAHGRSIPEIFETEGEEWFRDVEAEILEGVARRPGTVISPGGGIVLREANRTILRAQFTVYLEVPVEVLVERLKKSPGRPALTAEPLEQEVVSTFRARERFYREVARARLPVPGEETAEATLRRLLDLLDAPAAGS